MRTFIITLLVSFFGFLAICFGQEKVEDVVRNKDVKEINRKYWEKYNKETEMARNEKVKAEIKSEQAVFLLPTCSPKNREVNAVYYYKNNLFICKQLIIPSGWECQQDIINGGKQTLVICNKNK